MINIHFCCIFVYFLLIRKKSIGIIGFALPHFHFLPAEIAADIVDQKRNKAHDNGNIAYVRYALPTHTKVHL